MSDLNTQAKHHRELEEQSRRLANQTDHDEFRVEYMKKAAHYRTLAEDEERLAAEAKPG
jgi:hypothetical protein